MKKMLMAVVAIVLIVVISVSATFAYLTADDEVVNTFTIGDIKIKLDEVKVNAETGKATDDPRTEDGNENVKIIPGRTIDKDPTVWVEEGSEPAYIRMKVTISHYDELKAIFGNDFLPQYYVTGWDPAVWVSTGVITEDDAANTATYEFRYKEIYTAPDDDNDGVVEYVDLPALFTTFTLPGDKVNNTQLATLDGLSIKVVAEAMQAEGFEGNEADAWAKFVAPTD